MRQIWKALHCDNTPFLTSVPLNTVDNPSAAAKSNPAATAAPDTPAALDAPGDNGEHNVYVRHTANVKQATHPMTAAELNAAERAEAERRRLASRSYDDDDEEDDGYVSPRPRPQHHEPRSYDYDDHYDDHYAYAPPPPLPPSPRFRLRAMSPPPRLPPIPPAPRYLPPPDRHASYERSRPYDELHQPETRFAHRAHNHDAALLLEDDLGLRSPDRAKDKKRARAPPADAPEVSPVRAPPSAKKRRVEPEFDERERDRDRDRERFAPNLMYDPNGPSALSLAPDADTDVRMLSAYPHLHVPSRLPSPPLQPRGRVPSESPPPPIIITSTTGRGRGKGSRGGRGSRGGKTSRTDSRPPDHLVPGTSGLGLGLALYEEEPKPKQKRARKPKNGVDTGLPESFFPSSTPSVTAASAAVPSLPLRLAPGGGLGGVSAAESVGSASVASSPAGTPFIALDQPLPVLPAVGKVDHATLVKRAIQLEENQRKVWVSLARKDIPKVRHGTSRRLLYRRFIVFISQAYKLQSAGFQTKLLQTKKLAHLLSTHAKKPNVRTIATTKLTQVKSKRLMREMLVFWRKHDREEKDLRKKAERAQVDRAKAEEEKREAQRQARKLEFLISQTELYSHFVGSKLKSACPDFLLWSCINAWFGSFRVGGRDGYGRGASRGVECGTVSRDSAYRGGWRRVTCCRASRN